MEVAAKEAGGEASWASGSETPFLAPSPVPWPGVQDFVICLCSCPNALVPSCFLGQGRWQIGSCHRTCLDSFNDCSWPLGLKGPRGPALPTSHPTPSHMASVPFPSLPGSFDEDCPPLLALLSFVLSISMSLPQKGLPRPDPRSKLLSLCDPGPCANTHQARCLWPHWDGSPVETELQSCLLL